MKEKNNYPEKKTFRDTVQMLEKASFIAGQFRYQSPDLTKIDGPCFRGKGKMAHFRYQKALRWDYDVTMPTNMTLHNDY